MRNNRRRSRLLVLLIACSALSPLAGARASAPAPDFTVQAGAVNPVNALAPYDYTRFYPDVLRVHRGQTVAWTFHGLHAVAFLPADDGGAADPNPNLPGFARADELAGQLALDERFAFGSGCGSASEPVCVVSSTEQRYDSGADPARADGARFTATIDLPPGAYRYHCTVHATMKGVVNVVGDAVALPTQAGVDAQARADIAADTAEADLLRKDQSQHGTPNGDGTTTWNVVVGPDAPSRHVTLVDYVPSVVRARAGDSVRFTDGDGNTVNNAHTVTFPAGAVGSTASPVAGTPVPGGLAGAFAVPACDFDDRQSGAPGVPGLVACPANFEVLLSRHVSEQQRAPGDLVATPATYHNSALLLPAAAPSYLATNPNTHARFPSVFDAKFPAAGSFTYSCLLHGTAMTGQVSVT
jgi:plastocyanin